MHPRHRLLIIAATLTMAVACGREAPKGDSVDANREESAPMTAPLTRYVEVPLTADLASLPENERKMVTLLVDACREMDAIFWKEAYGDRAGLLEGIASDELRRFVEINYGPWDRLRGNEPFLPGVGSKPPGAGFYPSDMTTEEFEKAVGEASDGGDALKSAYTIVRRDASGRLVAVPYREAFADHVTRAAATLERAATLAEDPRLARYLKLRAEALRSDDYRPSDVAWMEMKNNTVDVVIGPIETYEDRLFGIRAAHEGFVLVKDKAWSDRLARYTKLLPGLQDGLPVPAEYRSEKPGTDSDLNAYDAVYYAGDCNAGSKTIAINLPNDETVQMEKGTRRLQIKNAMRAKFDHILVPIASSLVAEDQRGHVKFDAFFANVMFHEVAHGLGIKNTISGDRTVREAMREQHGALEEGKADVLGLYMVTRLHDMGELPDANIEDNYVTFMAGIFRSIRFGASSAHGRANLAQFEFLTERGAFARDPASGAWRVDFERMREAIDALASKILLMQGNGDYDGSLAFLPKEPIVGPELRADLDRLASEAIPTDVVWRFEVD